MKKQILRIIVMMLVTFLVASALVYYVFILNEEEEQEGDESKFYGTWKMEGNYSLDYLVYNATSIWTFHNNGSLLSTFIVYNSSGELLNSSTWSTWYLKNNELVIPSYDEIGEVIEWEWEAYYEFSDDYETLTLNDADEGVTLIYTKQ